MLVALHPEGVDRNGKALADSYSIAGVALHPEGVDRNNTWKTDFTNQYNVALHPEGVDRNAGVCSPRGRVDVALHPEGVDRNLYILVISEKYASSPSTRRAWIEILSCFRARLHG